MFTATGVHKKKSWKAFITSKTEQMPPIFFLSFFI